MSEKLIRLANLRALRKTANELSADVGGRYTYWRDLLKGDKAFGEKIARKIEQKLGLPPKSLDDAAVARLPGGSYRIGAQPATARAIDEQDWHLLLGVKLALDQDTQERMRKIGALTAPQPIDRGNPVDSTERSMSKAGAGHSLLPAKAWTTETNTTAAGKRGKRGA